MNHTTGVPCSGGHLISTQVSIRLLHELRSGIYSQAQRLPSEVDLAQSLGVSRTVIRDALSDLEREGLIERIRGIGTVINRDVVNLNNRLDLKVEYYDLIRAAGCRPSSDSVLLRMEPAAPELAEKLEIDAGAPVIVCEKRVLANGKPVIYSVDTLSKNLLDVPDYTMPDWNGPIFDILERYAGIAILSSACRVRATLGPPAIRQKLCLTEEDALLELEEVGCGRLGRPVLYSIGLYTNFFDFSMLRKRF